MLDLDPRDYDSPDEERRANSPSRGGRASPGDHDRDHDWRQPDARTRDNSGRGRVESVVLPHLYRHLAPLVADTPAQRSHSEASDRSVGAILLGWTLELGISYSVRDIADGLPAGSFVYVALLNALIGLTVGTLLCWLLRRHGAPIVLPYLASLAMVAGWSLLQAAPRRWYWPAGQYVVVLLATMLGAAWTGAQPAKRVAP